MKAGIIWIKFVEGVSDEVIQDKISSFYLKNELLIDGMGFNQLRDDDLLKAAMGNTKAFMRREDWTPVFIKK